MDWQAVNSSAELAEIVSNSYQISSTRIGSLLVSRGIINRQQLSAALHVQQRQPRRLGRILTERRWARDNDIDSALAHKFGIPCISLQKYPVSQHALLQVPAEFAVRYQLMPLSVCDNCFVIATARPFDNDGVAIVRSLVRYRVDVVMAPSDEIRLALDQYYSRHIENEAVEETARQLQHAAVREVSMTELAQQAHSRPVVRLLDSLLFQGLVCRASDINLRPDEHVLTVFYRIDGKLQIGRKLDKSLHMSLVNRIKILANMDISERREPQDGHARFDGQGRRIDLRVSTIPAMYGESVVIRLLDAQQGVRDLVSLGLPDREQRLLQHMITRPSGLILVVGPTGAGKTTTLYALLNEIKRQQKHILSVEDPVEYCLDGVEQVQVNPRKGVTFVSLLRHFLRHDPDVIMVGEIRDHETATLANRAALTGHLVISTLHTGDALGSIVRLLNMGIERYLLSDTLVGVISQRLVRMICPNCKVTATVSKAMRQRLGLAPEQPVWHGQGCSSCHQSGYSGRRLVTEILPVSATVAEYIASAASRHEMLALMREQGMRFLPERALELVTAGDTSVDEIIGQGLDGLMHSFAEDAVHNGHH